MILGATPRQSSTVVMGESEAASTVPAELSGESADLNATNAEGSAVWLSRALRDSAISRSWRRGAGNGGDSAFFGTNAWGAPFSAVSRCEATAYTLSGFGCKLAATPAAASRLQTAKNG